MKYFGERLKELRSDCKITQETFAEYLGISFQAVSKWENGISFPDISLLPAISNFFGVSSDFLLGIDLENSKSKVDKIIEEAEAYTHTGDIEKSIKIINEGLDSFPNDHKLLNKWISYNTISWNDSRSIDEIEAKAQLLLRDCTIDKIRHDTIVDLAFAYSFSGDKEKVAKMAELLPENPHSKDQILCFSVLPKDRFGIKTKCILREVEVLLSDLLCISKHHIIFGDPENCFEVIERVINIINNIGNEGFFLYFLAEAYKDLALANAKLKNREELYKNMDKVFNSYVEFESALLNGYEYTSPFLKGLTFNKDTVITTTTKNSFEWYYDLITKSKSFKPYQNDQRFIAFLEKLKARF